MNLSPGYTERDAAFNYHLLRNALEHYSRNLATLDGEQHRQVMRKAQRSYQLESLVLASDEAKGVVIAQPRLEQALAEVAARYEEEEEFLQDLQANGLNRDSLRDALHRELLFDAVMQKVASRAVEISDLDTRLFYELHGERFEMPELRSARHILITINPEFLENTRSAALERLQQIAEKLSGRVNRFAELARRYSECPTAMEGGKLGEVRRGGLYPELDQALFALQEGEISDIVESEIGFHLLLCEKIKPGKRTPFAKAAPRIHELLRERQRRNCQKAFLSGLQQT